MLEFLVYVSTAVRTLTAEELSHLVTRAAERNAAEGVTGLLLYSDGDFMQCIEGHPAALDKVYGIIKGDPMHSGIILLARDGISQREFADWHMALKSPDSALKSLTDSDPKTFLEDPAQRVPGSRAHALLNSFWNTHKH